ncbi:hypothetical protein [Roseovarius indicus]|uniref:hypothetical protein n=3 Tax=Roseovarius indicus TaxID=540747 RepID=UPI0007D8F47D|nr:hypothetical protein [Roseovarius indicus]OAO06400.1 hypothetical protein A8B76_08685 [Roseovarius indicus]
MLFRNPKFLLSSALFLLAAPVAAQVTTFPDDVVIEGDLTVDAGTTGSIYVEGDSVIDGSLCLGNTCQPTTTFANDETLILRYTQHSIVFDDTSSSSAPNRDWTLRVNDPNSVATGGIDKFAVEDDTAGTTPFTIAGGVPDNAFWLDTSGYLGLGTSMPQTSVHVVSPLASAVMRLEETNGTAGGFDIAASDAAFQVASSGNRTIPLVIEGTAPSNSLYVAGTGYVGFGTDTPAAPFEVSDDDSFSFFRITATGAPVNQSADVVFTQGPLNTGEFRYNIVDGDGPEMRLNADGDVTIAGKLTTAGSCSVGCDAVFDADYPLPSIEDHLAETLALGHLPNVGPTRNGEPWDVTDKMGRILNELEHAHLFIGQLNDRNAAQRARIEAQDSRIEALTAELASLAARLDARQN